MAASDSTPHDAERLLLVAYDDTTIFMNVSLVQECRKRGLSFQVVLLKCKDRGATTARLHVSERQLAPLRAVADLVELDANDLGSYSLAFTIVLVAKLPQSAVHSLNDALNHVAGERPVLVGFSSGLDASPNATLKNRIFVDLLLANSAHHLELLEGAPLASWRDRPAFGIGHPFFAQQRPARLRPWDEIRQIYFLHQSVWPSLLETRHEVFEFLLRFAEAFPEKQFFLKLRHLPNENHDNVNKERHPPSEYFASRTLPPNLHFDTSTFRETLERADLYVSVSSSGIIEGWVHGVPGIFVEGFTGEEWDPLSRAIVNDFRSAGIVVHRDRLLRGELPRIDQEALQPHLCRSDYFDDLLARVRDLRAAHTPLGRLHRLPLRMRLKGMVKRKARSLLSRVL